MKSTVSHLQADDRKGWEVLYQGYADFYQVAMSEQILDNVWSWIFDDSQAFYALVAKNSAGDLIGLMHCREMPSPLRGTMVGFLDDLFVMPDHRGSGCVQALYRGLNKLGKERGWPFVRWITAEDNYPARSLYDRIADKTQWQTYQMAID
ncbi:MAG: GNAT family N-acetyltransferase [Enterobacterales bacterium]|nr:GNAT family N-acetyltransferase [Enterobacterales bacterium]